MDYIHAKRKNECTAGTYESSAFILSLKDENEFCTLHSYGYHRVPLIGNSDQTFNYVIKCLYLN